MNKADSIALVRKRSGVLEKAEPGATRILSGMVADTLALAKKEQATNLVVSVAMCGWAEPHFQEIVEMIVRQGLATPSRVEFKFFFWTTDLLEAARRSRFDLFILWLNPGCFSRKDTAKQPLGRAMNWDDHGDEIDAYDFITGLKREFNRPVVTVSNCLKYESKTELEEAGADAVFWMPFGMDEFLSALSRCLKTPRRGVEKNEAPNRPVISILVAGGAIDRYGEFWEVLLTHDLGDQYAVQLVVEDHAVEVLKLAQQRRFDLFIVYLNQVYAGLDEFQSGPPDGEVLGNRMGFIKRLKAEFGKPIIALSAYEDATLANRVQRAGADVYLQQPFDLQSALAAVRSCLKLHPDTGAATLAKPPQGLGENVPQSRKSRPPRIVILDDEQSCRDSYSLMLKWSYDGVGVVQFDDPGAALQELSRSATDLFITDIHHSGMSCAEMLEHLAQRNVKYPILVISAGLDMYGEAERRSWGQGLNVSFLSKPVELEMLRTAVETALQIPAQRKP